MSNVSVPKGVFDMMISGLSKEARKDIEQKLIKVRDEADVIIIAMDMQFQSIGKDENDDC